MFYVIENDGAGESLRINLLNVIDEMLNGILPSNKVNSYVGSNLTFVVLT